MQLVDVSVISPGAQRIASAAGSPRVSPPGGFNCCWRHPTMSCAFMHQMELHRQRTFYTFGDWTLEIYILEVFRDYWNDSCLTVFIHRDALYLLDQIHWSCPLVPSECNQSVFRWFVLDVRKGRTALLLGFPDRLYQRERGEKITKWRKTWWVLQSFLFLIIKTLPAVVCYHYARIWGRRTDGVR